MMNKYLKGFINSIIMLAIGFVGLLFSINVWLMGLLFFPEVATKVYGVLDSNPSWSIWNLFPGLIPLFYLLTMITLFLFILFKTIKLAKNFDIEKIVNAIRTDFNSSKKRKEAKSE